MSARPFMRLSETPIGPFVRITGLTARSEVSTRLRELGFREDALVRCIVNSRGRLICEILDARIGIDIRLARDILVSAAEQDMA